MSNPVHQANQVVGDAVKFSPPAAYMGAKFLGMTPADWVTWLTLLYIIIQITLIIPKWWRQFGPWLIRRYIAVTLWLKSKETPNG